MEPVRELSALWRTYYAHGLLVPTPDPSQHGLMPYKLQQYHITLPPILLHLFLLFSLPVVGYHAILDFIGSQHALFPLVFLIPKLFVNVPMLPKQHSSKPNIHQKTPLLHYVLELGFGTRPRMAIPTKRRRSSHHGVDHSKLSAAPGWLHTLSAKPHVARLSKYTATISVRHLHQIPSSQGLPLPQGGEECRLADIASPTLFLLSTKPYASLYLCIHLPLINKAEIQSSCIIFSLDNYTCQLFLS